MNNTCTIFLRNQFKIKHQQPNIFSSRQSIDSPSYSTKDKASAAQHTMLLRRRARAQSPERSGAPWSAVEQVRRAAVKIWVTAVPGAEGGGGADREPRERERPTLAPSLKLQQFSPHASPLLRITPESASHLPVRVPGAPCHQQLTSVYLSVCMAKLTI